jgi:uncharacterized membrane protein YcaP (DUF421 family)
MWHIFVPDVTIGEKLLRAAVIYLFLCAAIRVSGKRQVGQMTPFDLVFLLIISNVVQNAVIGNDNSVGGGLIGAAAILAMNWGITEVAFRYKKARRLLEGEPVILIHNGKILHANMNRERISMDELMAALRDSGVGDPLHVRAAILEETGRISVMAHAGAANT